MAIPWIRTVLDQAPPHGTWVAPALWRVAYIRADSVSPPGFPAKKRVFLKTSVPETFWDVE